MKKIISIVLAFTMILSLAVPAFAGGDEQAADCNNVPVVLVR